MEGTIHCSRTDCDFQLCGECYYGGEAVEVTVEGCRTYEPKQEEETEYDDIFEPSQNMMCDICGCCSVSCPKYGSGCEF